ncbi:hypothetical protein YC2023_044655 [Brassica napus]
MRLCISAHQKAPKDTKITTFLQIVPETKIWKCMEHSQPSPVIPFIFYILAQVITASPVVEYHK